jgi:hypothetical protein
MVSASVPFLAVWLYEVSNLIVLAGQGYGVSLSMAGWLPLGVAGVSSGGISLLTKGLQIIVAVGLILPLGFVFSRSRLLVAETFVVSTVGIYLASAYWELLSILTVVPVALHTGLFIAGTSVLVVVLLREVSWPRHVQNAPSTTNTPRPSFY